MKLLDIVAKLTVAIGATGLVIGSLLPAHESVAHASCDPPEPEHAPASVSGVTPLRLTGPHRLPVTMFFGSFAWSFVSS
jgi:hypothetical protein